MTSRLEQLRASLRQHTIDGFILPVNDEFMGEYVPASARRLEWLTGFTGSAGMAVVLTERDVRRSEATTPQGEAVRSADGESVSPIKGAAFFTDGRYTLQASQQVQGYELHNSGDVAPEKWIAANAAKGAVIGFDPRLHTLNMLQRYRKTAKDVTFRPVESNPVDAIWEGRPAAPASAIQIHPLRYAGEEHTTKLKRMGQEVERQGADAAIITAADSICWLLNIRASDVPCTPFALCYALLSKDYGNLFLFIDPARITPELQAHFGQQVTVVHPDAMKDTLARFRGGRVLYDKAASPVWFHDALNEKGVEVVEGDDPCQPAKACKNATELDGTRNAHMRDGLAVVRFLHWLDTEVLYKRALTECSVAHKLEAFRRMSALFKEPSFATIAGSGPNGAIVHYHATPESDRALAGDAILLLDSGGQYPDGTTDITRTIAIGEPTPEMKDRFTRVLKGHIALATAIFPEGTSGGQLDALARQFLWAEGLDYDHGTGHGVGSYLSVHEGPQRISKRGGDVALKPGMILSNEPGYYRCGEYGIRIENLVVVKEHGEKAGRKFYAFETLTQAPIDMRLVDDALLTAAEKRWITEYHRAIYKSFAHELTPEELNWLARYSG